jgi:hypothetical protein
VPPIVTVLGPTSTVIGVPHSGKPSGGYSFDFESLDPLFRELDNLVTRNMNLMFSSISKILAWHLDNFP